MEEECLITKYLTYECNPYFVLDVIFFCATALYLTTHNTHNIQTSIPRWDSNPQSQQASCCRPTPYTVQLLVPPDVILNNQNNPLSSKMWLGNVYVGGKFHRTIRTEKEHSQSTAFSYDFCHSSLESV